MKVTPQHELLLKKLLSDVVLYQETFEEVYDHVVTALEEQASVVYVYKEAHQIIDNDFGGYKGIIEMEKARRNYVKKDLNIKYMICLKEYLRNPVLLFLLGGIAIGIYYVCSTFNISFLMPLVALAVITFMPWGYVLIQKYRYSVKENHYKDTIIADVTIGKKVRVPLFTAVALIYIGFMANLEIDNYRIGTIEKFEIAICAILFIGGLLNFIIFFKVYFSMFKRSANQWN